MALIDKTSIGTGNTIQSEHITRIIDALNESGSYEIIATGSFTGSFTGDGSGLTGVTVTSAPSATSASYAVTDPMGQWRHPGKCTMIPSGDITMQNVAYPVMGIDDTGHWEMMQPNQNYMFPGNQVFEIPQTAQWKTMLILLQNKLQNGTK